MNKTLILIRHAKSAHAPPLRSDFERPLSERGLRDAPLIGRHLREALALSPDCLISSPARRALTTATLIREAAGWQKVPFQEEPRIYEAPLETLTAVVRDIPDKFNEVVLFGHNPGFESLANWLCGKNVIEGLRTGGVVILDTALNRWDAATSGAASLRHYVYPALIGGGKNAPGT